MHYLNGLAHPSLNCIPYVSHRDYGDTHGLRGWDYGDTHELVSKVVGVPVLLSKFLPVSKRFIPVHAKVDRLTL